MLIGYIILSIVSIILVIQIANIRKKQDKLGNKIEELDEYITILQVDINMLKDYTKRIINVVDEMAQTNRETALILKKIIQNDKS